MILNNPLGRGPCLLVAGLLSIFLLLQNPYPAEARQTITEDQVVRAVEDHNFEIRSAGYGARADGTRESQVTWPFPMFETMLMPGMISEGEAGVQFQASQAIPWPDRLRADREVRRYMAEASAHEVDALVRERIMQARIAYADLWKSQQQIALTRGFRDQVLFFEEAARAQYEAGRAAQQAVLKAQIESERLTQRLEAMEDETANSIRQIEILTGGRIQIRLSDEVADPEVRDIPHILIGAQDGYSHPLLDAARSKEASEEAMIRMNRTMLRPQFTVGVGINLMPMARERMFGWEPLVPMIGLSLPLWRGGVRASVREAEFRQQQRALEREHISIELDSEVHTVLHHLEGVRSRLARYEVRLLPQAELSLESATTSYQTGRVPFIELLDMHRTLIDIGMDVVAERAREAAMVARLKALLEE